jgi:hypothetical protein
MAPSYVQRKLEKQNCKQNLGTHRNIGFAFLMYQRRPAYMILVVVVVEGKTCCHVVCVYERGEEMNEWQSIIVLVDF